MRFVRTFSALVTLMIAGAVSPALAQQTGTIVGKVMDSGGAVLPGVTIEATSSVLPTPRTTVSGPNGEFRLPALPPGDYSVKFELSGMQTVTRQAQVQLNADTVLEATLGVGGVTETVEVQAFTSIVDTSSASLKSGISNEQIRSIPVGQDYRDLIKLIPGVQVTQDTIRGPSAGGSGQDNVYQFDGVNVTMPLFGTLASEPASHDIDQVTTVRGGSRAVDFDRSGGFTIDSVSKSGTNRFSGLAQFQFQTPEMSSEQSGGVSRYDMTRSWTSASLGGPIVSNKAFFFGSYFRPTRSRDLATNAYGELPDFEYTRNEGFGKATVTPTSNVLINASYRDSKREETSSEFGQFTAGTAGSGSEARQRISIGELSWVLGPRSHFTAKYTNFSLETLGQPDIVSNAQVSTVIGTQIDLNALDTLGRFTVPTILPTNPAASAYMQPFIDRYGYVSNGVRNGGGIVGYGSQFDDNDFYRNDVKFGYNLLFGDAFQHDLHVGYQWYRDEEDLARSSNGWGLLSVPAGTISTSGVPVFVRAQFQQQGIPGLNIPVIHSEYQSQSFEVNDTIRWQNFTVNLGLLASHDTLYGQGLREDSSATLTGFRAAVGSKYEMYDLPFSKMLQPRVSANWAFNGRDTVYASYARYHPAASSLPRAAAWDRNLAVVLNADFDAEGRLFAVQQVRSSSGKLFVEDLDPRQTDEFLLGAAFQLTPSLSLRAYGRYRESSNFWEDVPNAARQFLDAPPEISALGPYIPDLNDRRLEIGNGALSGSTYVIAELDGAYTKYQEATVESEWRGQRAFVRASYTYSKYWGNFDQDNTGLTNDANIFIGSSRTADGPGRQLWNFRDGRLRGDRPHMLKLYGYYQLPWKASAGAFVFAQSGQPWEAWSRVPYIPIGPFDSLDDGMYIEPAGSRRSDSHAQLDLNYTQDVPLGGRYRVQLIADVYNVFDKQTGYSIQPVQTNPQFGNARLFYDPRRLQLAARFVF